MKNFALLLFISLFSFKSFAQYSGKQTIGNDSNFVKAKGGFSAAMLQIPSFSDTAAANAAPYVNFYNGSLIKIETDIWLRHDGGWYKTGGSAAAGGRFGIEDRVGTRDRQMNMDGNFFYITAGDSNYVNPESELRLDQNNLTIYSQDENDVNNVLIRISPTTATIQKTIDFAGGAAKEIVTSAQINGTEYFADITGKVDLGTIGGSAFANNGDTVLSGNTGLGGSFIRNTAIDLNAKHFSLSESSGTNGLNYDGTQWGIYASDFGSGKESNIIVDPDYLELAWYDIGSGSLGDARFVATSGEAHISAYKGIEIEDSHANGGATAAASAVVDIRSIANNKGMLIPRLTTTQRTSISSPAEGLMVYDKTLHKLYVYDGTAWQAAW